MPPRLAAAGFQVFVPKLLLRLNEIAMSVTEPAGAEICMTVDDPDAVVCHSRARVSLGGTETTGRSSVIPDGIVRILDSSLVWSVPAPNQTTSGFETAEVDALGQIVTLRILIAEAQYRTVELAAVHTPPQIAASCATLITTLVAALPLANRNVCPMVRTVSSSGGIEGVLPRARLPIFRTTFFPDNTGFESRTQLPVVFALRFALETVDSAFISLDSAIRDELTQKA